MWKLLTRVVNAAEMRTIIAWFVASAVLQGLTLALMIPFLRALYSRSQFLTAWLIAVVVMAVSAALVETIAMRRSYRTKRFMGILDKVRERIPNAAITTDIIVGFPGETEEDFQGTMDIVEQARFAQAFTFQYSIRPGTPAAEMDNQIPKDVVQERFERLTALQDRISLEENQALVGTEAEILVTGLPDEEHGRFSGRARDNRLVHVKADPDTPVRPGDFVTTTLTEAKPYFLIADAPYTLRTSPAGDAWDLAQADSCGAGSNSAGPAGPTVLGCRPSAHDDLPRRRCPCRAGVHDRRDTHPDTSGRHTAPSHAHRDRMGRGRQHRYRH